MRTGTDSTRLLRGFIAAIRADHWWEYKLVPALSFFYATALMVHRPLLSMWRSALVLLLALASAAAFVSLVNDITDRDSDAGAGKLNRWIGRPAWQMWAMVA